MHPSFFIASRLFLLAAAALALASCKTQEKPAPTPLPSPGADVAPAWFDGQYQGSYAFGSAFADRAGQSVRFVLTLHQVPGTSQITGTMSENSGAFGLTSDVTGTCVREGDVIHLRFSKTYRRGKRPVENYLGSLPLGSTFLSGIWYDAETSTGSGTFQFDSVPVR